MIITGYTAICLNNVPPASSQPGRMSPYMLIASFWRESSSLCGNTVYLIFAVYLLCPSPCLLLSMKASAAVILYFKQRCLHQSSEAVRGNLSRKNGKDGLDEWEEGWGVVEPTYRSLVSTSAPQVLRALWGIGTDCSLTLSKAPSSFPSQMLLWRLKHTQECIT